MKVDLSEFKPYVTNDRVYLVNGKEGYVIDAQTMKRCGSVTPNGYTTFAKDKRLHRVVYELFTDWATHKTPSNFPGGYEAWSKLKIDDRKDFLLNWAVVDHVDPDKNNPRFNARSNLQLLSTRANSSKGNKVILND